MSDSMTESKTGEGETGRYDLKLKNKLKKSAAGGGGGALHGYLLLWRMEWGWSGATAGNTWSGQQDTIISSVGTHGSLTVHSYGLQEERHDLFLSHQKDFPPSSDDPSSSSGQNLANRIKKSISAQHLDPIGWLKCQTTSPTQKKIKHLKWVMRGVFGAQCERNLNRAKTPWHHPPSHLRVIHILKECRFTEAAHTHTGRVLYGYESTLQLRPGSTWLVYTCALRRTFRRLQPGKSGSLWGWAPTDKWQRDKTLLHTC